jgi:hypothetical protein
MSSLEQSNIPLIGNLMQDVAFSLNGLQQYQVATWAVKMSMVGDFLGRSHRPLFFDQAERDQLRATTNLPVGTSVWLARYAFPDHIGFWGTNAWSLDRTVHAFIATVLVGHLAVQAITLHYSEGWDGNEVTVTRQSGPRPWPEMLTEIWPTKMSAQWPPRFSFTNEGTFRSPRCSVDIPTAKTYLSLKTNSLSRVTTRPTIPALQEFRVTYWF